MGIKSALLLSSFFFITNAWAQITIDQADMPQPGDNFITTSTVIDLGIDPEQTGSNFSWDFSQVTPLLSAADSFVAYNELPVAYQFFFFGSNLADKTGIAFTIDQISLEDVYFVYKNSSSAFELYGYAGTFSGIPIPVLYSAKDIVYRFPIQFGNMDSSESGFAFGLPGFAFISQERKRINTVDGWGTIKTPTGIFDVLRVKSVITDVDSVYVDTLGSGTTATLESIEYKWLTTDGGIPVFQVNAQDVGGFPVVTQILYMDTAFHTSVGQVEEELEQIMLFPNPVADRLQVKWLGEQAESIELIMSDASGKIISVKHLDHWTSSIDVASYSSGLYFLVLSSGSKTYRSKFVVQH